jgi:hypothetical protein
MEFKFFNEGVVMRDAVITRSGQSTGFDPIDDGYIFSITKYYYLIFIE